MKTVLLIVALVFSFVYTYAQKHSVPAYLLTHVSEVMNERYTNWNFTKDVEFQITGINSSIFTCYVRGETFDIKCAYECGWDVYINDNWDEELTMELRSKDHN